MGDSKKIADLFEKGILINKELLEKGVADGLIEKMEVEPDLLVLNSDYADVIEQQTSLVDWYDIDRYRVAAEKDRDNDLYQDQLQNMQRSTLGVETPGEVSESNISSLEVEVKGGEANIDVSSEKSPDDFNPAELTNLTDDLSVTVVVSYQNIPKKYGVKDFANIFVSRYRFIETILRNRHELQGSLTISRLLAKKEKEQVALIGIVEDIAETKNANIIITLEDPTGKAKVLISKTRKDLYLEGKDLVVDEVVGITGKAGDQIVFADSIIWPDIPATHELKKGPEEEFAVFLSDIHVGSNLFLMNEFQKFIRWIRQEAGTDSQREIAKKVKYVFIAGDLVDGIGIYPSQEEELSITNISDQYKEFCRLIKEIPSNIPIIICPGNHDIVHLAEPQSAFDNEFAAVLNEIPNITLVTNPSLINVGKTKDFSGFDVLMYHGYSFDYYVANVESIRLGGGYRRADLIMKFLLQRRHLAPAFKSTPYYPSYNEDPLIIKKIPDFFVTGHIHYCSVSNYKGITMISGSCWQDKTSFQEKLGHEPEPARVPVVNLKTREVKVMRFG